jgi:hypothetical protein
MCTYTHSGASQSLGVRGHNLRTSMYHGVAHRAKHFVTWRLAILGYLVLYQGSRKTPSFTAG